MTNQEILEGMIQATRIGGDQALAKQGRTNVVSDEGGGSLTTQQDHDSQVSIITKLSDLFPDINILAEEKPDKVVTGNDFIVDPIDASVNYARYGRDWCCTTAHKTGDDVDIGVIWQPRTQILVSAIRDQGCWFMERGQRRRITLSPTAPFDLSKSVIQMPISGDFTDAVLNEVQLPLIKATRFVRNTFSNTGSIIELLQGICDAFIGYGSLWDFAAGKLFVEEAGGITGTMTGDPIDINLIAPQKIVFAASQDIFDTVINFTKNWPANDIRPKKK